MIKFSDLTKSYIFYLTAFLIAIITLTTIIYSHVSQNKYDAEISQESATLHIDRQIDQHTDPNLIASAALVWDKNDNHFIYDKNSNVSLPIASITKIMTAIAAIEYLPIDTIINIKALDLATEGTSGLILGEQWTRDDLISYTLITSSNDGASALARTISETSNRTVVEIFNRISQNLQLENYTWENPTGLDTIDGMQASNRATAKDVIKLSDYLLTNYPDIALSSAKKIATYSSNITAHEANSTNQLASILPHTLSAKTGFTFVAGGNLLVVTDMGPARPLYIVVLGSTAQNRFSDVEKLYNYSLDKIKLM